MPAHITPHYSREGLKNVTHIAHIFGVGYFYVFMTLVIWLEVCVVIPEVFDKLYYFVLMGIIYIALNVFLNHLYLMKSDVSCKAISLSPGQQAEKDGYYFCQSCEQQSPARAHHCGFCGTCVARRDHHCFIIANCVGLANLRFFIVFSFFVCGGCALSLICNCLYLQNYLGVLTNSSFWINLLLPYTLYKWWIGSLTGYLVLVVIATYLCLLKVFVSFGVVCFYLMLLNSGQTLYERKHAVTHYSQGDLQTSRTSAQPDGFYGGYRLCSNKQLFTLKARI